MIADVTEQSPRLPYAVLARDWSCLRTDLRRDARTITIGRMVKWCVEQFGEEGQASTVYQADALDDGTQWYRPRHLNGRLWLFRRHADALAFVLRWRD